MAKNFFSGLFGKKKQAEEKVQEAPSAVEHADDDSTVEAEGVDLHKEEASSSAIENEHELEAALTDIALEKSEAKQEVLPEKSVIDDAQTPPAEHVEEPTKEKKKGGWLSRLRAGLSKSSNKLAEGVSSIFTKSKLDDDTIEDLHDLLVTADLGVAAATRITDALAKDRFDKDISDGDVKAALASEVAATLTPLQKPLEISSACRPHILLMVGVNGAGKTTTIGKLARQYSDAGLKVMLAAGDTFRAAAIEQLQVWGERTGAPVVSRKVGADAAGLAFDAVKQAQEEGVDVLMIDTAGRLQNKRELMDELAKIVRVIKKLDEDAPHDVILTLDATVGQNALSQAEVFTEIAGVTGLVMTKLDGTARGGVLVALADKFSLPIHYIGVGEGVEDLQAFNAEQFAQALAGVGDIAA